MHQLVFQKSETLSAVLFFSWCCCFRETRPRHLSVPYQYRSTCGDTGRAIQCTCTLLYLSLYECGSPRISTAVGGEERVRQESGEADPDRWSTRSAEDRVNPVKTQGSEDQYRRSGDLFGSLLWIAVPQLLQSLSIDSIPLYLKLHTLTICVLGKNQII